jgi:hypothetical protein
MGLSKGVLIIPSPLRGEPNQGSRVNGEHIKFGGSCVSNAMEGH